MIYSFLYFNRMEFEWNGSGKFGAVSFRGIDMPEIEKYFENYFTKSVL